MLNWFAEGGVMMWPILAAGLVALGLAVDAGRRVRDAGEGGGRPVRGRIDAVLFWGVFAALLGVLGTVVGIALTADALARAGGGSAQLAWQGLGVTLNTTTFGLLVLLLSLGAWFGLRTAHARRAAT